MKNVSFAFVLVSLVSFFGCEFRTIQVYLGSRGKEYGKHGELNAALDGGSDAGVVADNRVWSTLRIALNLAALAPCDAPPEREPGGHTNQGWVIQVRYNSAGGFIHESRPGSWFFEESHDSVARVHVTLRCGTHFQNFSSFVGRAASAAGFASITDTSFDQNLASLAQVCSANGVVFQTHSPYGCQ